MNKILLLVLLSFLTHALEIDEKLTLRLLEVSKSKKTVLINRGLEDGLVIGDHAKFFITTGVIARGVVIKASPARSIWSIYRIVRPDAIAKSTVLNIKISSAVKLTSDSSKSIRSLVVSDDFGEPTDIIKVESSNKSKNMEDLMNEDSSSSSDSSEISSLMGDSVEDVPVKTNLSRATRSLSLEAWGLLSMSSLSGSYKSSGISTNSSQSTFTFSGGLEKYFANSTGFFKNISLKLLLSKKTDEFGSEGTSTIDQLDMGGGVAYYFGPGPYKNNKMIYFIDGLYGVSSITLSSSATPSDSREGAGNFLSIGAGFKYMFQGKFGGVGRADYYSSSTAFDIDYGDGKVVTHEYAVSGPRVTFGVFYRFM